MRHRLDVALDTPRCECGKPWIIDRGGCAAHLAAISMAEVVVLSAQAGSECALARKQDYGVKSPIGTQLRPQGVMSLRQDCGLVGDGVNRACDTQPIVDCRQ